MFLFYRKIFVNTRKIFFSDSDWRNFAFWLFPANGSRFRLFASTATVALFPTPDKRGVGRGERECVVPQLDRSPRAHKRKNKNKK